MIVIVDYGVGNLLSLKNAFWKIGVNVKISANPEDIKNAKAIVLPGVGAFKDAINNLHKRNLINVIKQQSKEKIVLGICLGMQLLYDKSFENGEFEGLGLLRGEVKKLSGDHYIPHIGWNNLKFHAKDSIIRYTNENDDVYFLHSYFVDTKDSDVIAYADYGIQIPAIIRHNNIYGMQFHPEKSGQVGELLFIAFKEIVYDNISSN